MIDPDQERAPWLDGIVFYERMQLASFFDQMRDYVKAQCDGNSQQAALQRIDLHDKLDQILDLINENIRRIEQQG